MKRHGGIWVLLFSLFLCGCAAKNGKLTGTTEPAESESFVIGLEPSESESESEPDRSGEYFFYEGEDVIIQNSEWEPYGTPIDLAIQMEDGTMQFDSVCPDQYTILLTYHFTPSGEGWEPGTEVDGWMRKGLRHRIAFSLRSKEGKEEPFYTKGWNREGALYDSYGFEKKVRQDGSVGGTIWLDLNIPSGRLLPVQPDDVLVLSRGGDTTDRPLVQEQSYTIPLDHPIDRIELTTDEFKTTSGVKVESATLSVLSYMIYGSTPPVSEMIPKTETSKQNVQADLNRLHVGHCRLVWKGDDGYLALYGGARWQLYPSLERGYFYSHAFFVKPIDFKKVEGISLESGEMFRPE